MNTFVGREGELNQITESFKTSNTLLLVNGVGGIGKSTIAKEFLNANLSLFDYKIWINYKNSLISSIVNDLNINFGFKGEEAKIYNKIISELNNFVGNNLMVIDNFDNPTNEDRAKVKKFLPNFKIIITSRNEIDGIEKIKIEELSESEAIELFKKHYTKSFSEEELKKLLSQIGYHSLLIELIAKALQSSYSNTIATIQERFEKKELAKIKTEVYFTTDKEGVEEDKKALIVEHIRELFNLENLSNSQILILKRFAILPSVEIEFNDLIEMFGVKEVEEFDNELRGLIEKGWINETNNSFKMHQLIIEFINFENRAIYEEVKEVVQYFIDKIEKVYQVNPINGFKYIPFVKNILELIKEENKETATLYDRTSLIYQYLGDLNNALEFAKKSLKIRENILNKKHPDLATSYNSFAIIYKDLGDLNNALEFAKKSLEIRESVLDKYHHDLAVTYNTIAIIYQDLGDLNNALEFAKKSLKIREIILDKKHPSLAKLYNNLSTIYYSFGELKESLKFAKKALEIQEKVLDKNHPDLASLYNNLSMIYQDLGDLESAIEFAKKSLTIREKIFDKNHISLASSYNNLSTIYQDLGDLNNALEFAKKSIVILEHNVDEIHPQLATSYNNLSMIYKDLKEYQKAKKYITKAIKILEIIFPNGHHYLIIAKENLRTIESATK